MAVLTPPSIAEVLAACSCEFSWRVLLLACGQVRWSHWPQYVFPIVFGHLHYACRLLPQASCNLLSASRLLRWLCAFCDAGVWV